MAGRVMSLTHRGTTVVVKERQDDTCISDSDAVTGLVADKKFPAACRAAMKWLLEHGGDMRGDYSR
jgi:hypothetical protein